MIILFFFSLSKNHSSKLFFFFKDICIVKVLDLIVILCFYTFSSLHLYSLQEYFCFRYNQYTLPKINILISYELLSMFYRVDSSL